MSDLHELVMRELETVSGVWKGEHGFYVEIYADQSDELSQDNVTDIVNSNFPKEKLDELMDEWYRDSEGYVMNEVIAELMKNESIAAFGEDRVQDEVYEWVEVRYPYDHFLDSDVQLDLIIDSGDANYDFSLNNILNWYGLGGNGSVDSKSSLLWLAKSQRKAVAFRKACKACFRNDSNYANRETDNDKFVESMITEAENDSCSSSCLVFLVSMTLRNYLKVQEKLKEEQNWDVDTPVNVRECESYLTVGKTAICGLYDFIEGGGSCLGIDLAKDVKVPFSVISSLLPDGCRGYSVHSIFGNDDSDWKDCVEVHLSDNKKQKVAA